MDKFITVEFGKDSNDYVSVIHRSIYEILGDRSQAAVLNQILYWYSMAVDECNAGNHQFQTPLCRRTYEQLAKDVFMERHSVKKAISKLIDKGYISKTKNPQRKADCPADNKNYYSVNVAKIQSEIEAKYRLWAAKSSDEELTDDDLFVVENYHWMVIIYQFMVEFYHSMVESSLIIERVSESTKREKEKIDRSDIDFSASPLAKIDTVTLAKIDSDPIKIDTGCYSKPKIDIPASPSSPTDADTPAQPVLQTAEYDGRGYPLLHTFVSFGVSQGYPSWLCEWVHMDMSSKGFKLRGNPIENWRHMLKVYADNKLSRGDTEKDFIALKSRLSDKDNKKGSKKASQTAPFSSGQIKKAKLIIPTPLRFVEDMGVNDVIMNWDFTCSCGHTIPGNSEKCPDCGVGFDWTKVNPLVLVKDSPEQMQRDLLN